jgi:caffeoyl-CoA O-methyltransferase
MENQENAESYIMRHCTAEDRLLAELNRQTYLRMLNPGMLSGHYQGKFLELISHMINPELVLEIGTFTGYSAICMARGMKENGKLHTIEIDDEIRNFAMDFIRRSGLENKIIMHTGNALEIIPKLKGPFDLVFIDGEKSEYRQYFQLLFPSVRKGGFIVADNVLWKGKVYGPGDRKDDNTGYIIEFNKMIQEDDRVDNLLLDIRDGLMVIRKK